MNCVVTGAAGFIGRELCAALQARGDTVVAGLRSAGTGPWERALVGDLVDSPPPVSDLADVECVFHLAGKAHAIGESRRADAVYYQVNTDATRLLLARCREAGVRRFVYMSTVKAGGEGGDEVLDETAHSRPDTPYGLSKLAAERLVLEGGYVPEPVVLRPTMVYGPTRKGNLPRMVEAIRRGRFPPLPETAGQRSMVHVADVARAALLVSQSPRAAGQCYILTDGQRYSTREIYDWICEALGRPVPRWRVPQGALRAAAALGDLIGSVRGKRFIFDSDALDKLTCTALYSSEKIESQLGFRPQYDLRAALPGIVAALRARG